MPTMSSDSLGMRAPYWRPRVLPPAGRGALQREILQAVSTRILEGVGVMASDFSHFRIPVAILAMVGLACSIASVARAEGTARIQQADGAVSTYHNVKIQLLNKTLTMTSPDGKGTLMIYRAACAYQGSLLVCLPTGTTLIQGGTVSPIKLVSGTVYANMTDTPQNLSNSSTQLPPHGILMALKTERGTYVSLNGTIDKVK
jgi:hypothetical protein